MHLQQFKKSVKFTLTYLSSHSRWLNYKLYQTLLQLPYSQRLFVIDSQEEIDSNSIVSVEWKFIVFKKLKINIFLLNGIVIEPVSGVGHH